MTDNRYLKDMKLSEAATRQHFVAFANMLKDIKHDHPDAHKLMAPKMADVLATMNDRFDREKFLQHAGHED